jgi:hypothetical protein
MRDARLDSGPIVLPRMARAYPLNGRFFTEMGPSNLCYHARLRVGRYIWRGKRPTRFAPEARATRRPR